MMNVTSGLEGSVSLSPIFTQIQPACLHPGSSQCMWSIFPFCYTTWVKLYSEHENYNTSLLEDYCISFLFKLIYYMSSCLHRRIIFSHFLKWKKLPTTACKCHYFSETHLILWFCKTFIFIMALQSFMQDAHSHSLYVLLHLKFL